MGEEIKSLLPEKNSETNYKTGYAHITLTEEESDKALYDARKKKDGEIRAAEYWEKVKKGPEIIKLNNEQLQKYVSGKMLTQSGKTFLVDKWNKEIFDFLTLYFNNDPMFETAGYSLNKGILIQGGVGCGKTTLLKMFSQNPKASYIFTACDKIASKFSEGGFPEIEKYNAPVKTTTDAFGHSLYGIFFDDLGTDREKKYFGNEANVMEDILLSWYNRFDSTPERIHLTTNLSFDEIEQKYGTRCRSRMREMFNVFQFSEEAPDRRK